MTTTIAAQDKEEHYLGQIGLLIKLCSRLAQMHYMADCVENIIKELTEKKLLTKADQKNIKRIMQPNTESTCRCSMCKDLRMMIELHEKDLKGIVNVEN